MAPGIVVGLALATTVWALQVLFGGGLWAFGQSGGEGGEVNPVMPRIDHADSAIASAEEFRNHLKAKGTAEQRQAAKHVLTVIGIISSKDGDIHIGTDLDDDPNDPELLDEEYGGAESHPAKILALAYANWKSSKTDATVNVYNAADQRLVSGIDL
jgi:hypothetical protein